MENSNTHVPVNSYNTVVVVMVTSMRDVTSTKTLLSVLIIKVLWEGQHFRHVRRTTIPIQRLAQPVVV